MSSARSPSASVPRATRRAADAARDGPRARRRRRPRRGDRPPRTSPCAADRPRRRPASYAGRSRRDALSRRRDARKTHRSRLLLPFPVLALAPIGERVPVRLQPPPLLARRRTAAASLPSNISMARCVGALAGSASTGESSAFSTKKRTSARLGLSRPEREKDRLGLRIVVLDRAMRQKAVRRIGPEQIVERLEPRRARRLAPRRTSRAPATARAAWAKRFPAGAAGGDRTRRPSWLAAPPFARHSRSHLIGTWSEGFAPARSSLSIVTLRSRSAACGESSR